MALVERFASIAEFLTAGEKIRFRDSTLFDGTEYGGGHSWDLGLSGSEAVERALRGDIEIASVMVAALNHQPRIADVERSRYVPAFSGSRVHVPSYLAGNPMCMRARKRAASQGRRVRIFVALTTSAAVSAQDMLRRGQKILGFLEYLQASQIGVELHLVNKVGSRIEKNYYMDVQIQEPLDLSMCGFALAHPAFVRRLMYSYAHKKIDAFGAWNADRENHAAERKALGMDPDDMWLPEVYSGDGNVDAQIKAQLDRLGIRDA